MLTYCYCPWLCVSGFSLLFDLSLNESNTCTMYNKLHYNLNYLCLFQAVLTSELFQSKLRDYQKNKKIKKLDEKERKLCVFARRYIIEAQCPLNDVEITVTFNFDGSKEFKVSVGTGKQKVYVYYDEKGQRTFKLEAISQKSGIWCNFQQATTNIYGQLNENIRSLVDKAITSGWEFLVKNFANPCASYILQRLRIVV